MTTRRFYYLLLAIFVTFVASNMHRTDGVASSTALAAYNKTEESTGLVEKVEQLTERLAKTEETLSGQKKEIEELKTLIGEFYSGRKLVCNEIAVSKSISIGGNNAPTMIVNRGNEGISTVLPCKTHLILWKADDGVVYLRLWDKNGYVDVAARKAAP